MNFQFKIRTGNGEIVTGVQDAPNRTALIQQMQAQGLHPIVVIPAPQPTAPPKTAVKQAYTAAPKRKTSIWNSRIGKAVTDEEVLILTRDLLSLLHAGIPLVSGFEDIAGQIKNKYLKEILLQISEDINRGSKLSEAFAARPDVFSEFYVNSLQAGEEAGRLEDILTRLIDTMQHEVETRLAIKNAVRYPVIVLCFLVIAFVLIITIVIPRVSKVFAQFDTALPLPTRIIIWIGSFTHDYGVLVAAVFGLALVSLGFYIRTASGKLAWDLFKLKMPAFGTIYTKVALIKFASTMQSLYASGVVLPTGLDIASRVVGNEIIGGEIRRALKEVIQGKSLSDSLRGSRFFPPLVIRMIMMGEQTGNLDGMLGEMVQYYDREIRYITKTITTMIEPILTVCLGLMILVLALGVFLPMWNVISLFKH